MRELSQEEILSCALPFWLGILNLMHGSENRPLILSGDAIECEDTCIAKAISTASRTGFQQDAALGSEQFSEFLLYDLDDKDRAISQLKDVIRLYSNWGAVYEADTLREKHSKLLAIKMPETVECV
eukprot:scaffold117147_cov66-Attheya_sp.AAC.3